MCDEIHQANLCKFILNIGQIQIHDMTSIIIISSKNKLFNENHLESQITRHSNVLTLFLTEMHEMNIATYECFVVWPKLNYGYDVSAMKECLYWESQSKYCHSITLWAFNLEFTDILKLRLVWNSKIALLCYFHNSSTQYLHNISI